MKRLFSVAFVLLIASSAQAADLFTIVVPTQFQGINPEISHVGVTCELQQSKTSILYSGPNLAPRRKTVVVPLKQYSGEPSPGRFPGGNLNSPVTIVFTDLDFTVADASHFGKCLCWFDLRGTNGTVHVPSVPDGMGAPDSSFLTGFVTSWDNQHANGWLPLLQPNKPTLQPGYDYLYRWQSKLWF